MLVASKFAASQKPAINRSLNLLHKLSPNLPTPPPHKGFMLWAPSHLVRVCPHPGAGINSWQGRILLFRDSSGFSQLWNLPRAIPGASRSHQKPWGHPRTLFLGHGPLTSSWPWHAGQIPQCHKGVSRCSQSHKFLMPCVFSEGKRSINTCSS